jgi:hypothetical protein
MRRVLRENALAASIAGVATLTMGWLGLYGFGWNDYDMEARPALQALTEGHVLRFLQLAPVYGGSLIERAPFALAPTLWGGGELAVYRMVALPCLLAAAGLGLWLVANLRTRQRTKLARALALGICVANPLTLSALELGHPEDLLGAALCVVAVLLALRDRPLWAGVVLGLAIANKQWALLAVGPVLVALPGPRFFSRERVRCAAAALVSAAAVLAPLILVNAGGFVAATRATASTSSEIFQPWQAWWFLAHHGPIVHGLLGNVKVGYRTAPAWIGRISHPLVVALALPLSALYWWRQKSSERGRASTPLPRTDALALLALLLLVRCMLDTWDTSYYALPLIFALLAWELSAGVAQQSGHAAAAAVAQRSGHAAAAADALEPTGARELPLLALAVTVAAWADYVWLPAHISADAQAALFLLWSVPLLAALAGALAGSSRRASDRHDVRVDDPLLRARAGAGAVGGQQLELL